MVNEIKFLRKLLSAKIREKELEYSLNVKEFQKYDEGLKDSSPFEWFKNSSDPEGDKKALACIKMNSMKLAFEEIYMLLSDLEEV